MHVHYTLAPLFKLFPLLPFTPPPLTPLLIKDFSLLFLPFLNKAIYTFYISKLNALKTYLSFTLINNNIKEAAPLLLPFYT